MNQTFGPGRDRYNKYSNKAFWNCNKNYTDPQTLLDRIVAKPSDLIYRIYFHYIESRNGSDSTRIDPTLDNLIVQNIDHSKLGRCFTVVPTQEMIQRTITAVKLQPKIITVRVYNGSNRYLNFLPSITFHAPGTFKKVKTHSNSLTIYPELHKSKTYLLKYDIHTKQEFASDPPCEDNPKYDYELCIDQYIENKARQIYGCTTP